MKSVDLIPFYAPGAAALGFRTIEAAQRLISCGFVKPSYGRKGHLRAIWLQQERGGNPVETIPPSGTKYSYIETLEHARCWTLRRLDRRDESGGAVSTRPAFLQVVTTASRPRRASAATLAVGTSQWRIPSRRRATRPHGRERWGYSLAATLARSSGI